MTTLDGVTLQRIAAAGKSIAAKADEVAVTGTFADLEELRADIPAGVRQLTRIPVLGHLRYQGLDGSPPFHGK